MTQETPNFSGLTLPVLPLRDIVVFPAMIVPLFVGRDKSVAALEAAMAADKQIFLVAQRDPGEDDPGRDDLYDLGVTATVLQLLKLPDGTVRVLVEGHVRGRLATLSENDSHLVAEIEAVSDVEAEGAQVQQAQALMRSVIDQFENYAKLNRKLSSETATQLGEIEEAGKLSDAVALVRASLLSLSVAIFPVSSAISSPSDSSSSLPSSRWIAFSCSLR